MTDSHAHVRPCLSRARDVRANSDRTARECPRDCGADCHDCHDCWTAAVSAELVACTLGARSRPELMVRGDGIEPPTYPV